MIDEYTKLLQDAKILGVELPLPEVFKIAFTDTIIKNGFKIVLFLLLIAFYLTAVFCINNKDTIAQISLHSFEICFGVFGGLFISSAKG